MSAEPWEIKVALKEECQRIIKESMTRIDQLDQTIKAAEKEKNRLISRIVHMQNVFSIIGPYKLMLDMSTLVRIDPSKREDS